MSSPSPLAPLPPGFAATVASLHRVAEEIVAPARKPDNEIALEALPGGFGTPAFEYRGARGRVRVEGDELVREVDGAERRAPLSSLAAAAAAVADLLPDGGAGLGDEPLAISAGAATALAAWYEFGTSALAALAAAATPADEATPAILWPEHFDVAIELGAEAAGERATYGFSPGDGDHPEPYAYVAPWRTVSGELWQATGFGGAELGYGELLAAPDRGAVASRFFQIRHEALRRHPT